MPCCDVVGSSRLERRSLVRLTEGVDESAADIGASWHAFVVRAVDAAGCRIRDELDLVVSVPRLFYGRPRSGNRCRSRLNPVAK